MDNTERAATAEAAVNAFRKACRGDREDAVQDLICNLMHLAEADGDDPLVIVKNAISHHFAETHHERAATVEITVTPTQYPRPAPKYSELVKLLGDLRNLVSCAVVAANSEPDTLAENMGAIFDLVMLTNPPK